MNRIVRVLLLLFASAFASHVAAQEPQKLKGPDERYKVDILVVVAHPDDEGAVTPYLARAIYDLHKSVAVVFGTRGGSGGNDYRREHGPAMADVREIEAREACAKLGIDKVWFLGGKDTASQNVLNSLANWGHGQSLEEMVRIVRLTRPEIVITWLPGIFIGENHGDHQAAGVLATEAFDLANDVTAFPAQLAGASKRLEPYLENLTPWQPKKIYYFSDANDQKQFAGHGFAYSVLEVSPSQKKPYWLLAMRSAQSHLTQFPEEIHRWASLDDEAIQKAMSDPSHLWWGEPETLIFGKAAGKRAPNLLVVETTDPFAEVETKPIASITASLPSGPFVKMGGPWEFYDAFRAKHGLWQLPTARGAEIAVKPGTVIAVPVHILRSTFGPSVFTLTADVPEGWKATSGSGKFSVEQGTDALFRVEVQIPELSKEQLKDAKPQTITVHVSEGDKPIGDVKLKVQLVSGGVPQ
ncbi:MAG TPA: PIG-L family deacetylase [Candidatus Acidoferrum sp.]|nr:PIG-L family deacetylase [Candidatus Acidoferrum sp.]